MTPLFDKVSDMKQTILVTGGAGYIGSWIVKDLIEKGHTVRVSVRDKSKTEKYSHLLDLDKQFSGTIELWEADLTVPNSFDEVAKGCDSIIHVASPFLLSLDNPQQNLIDPALKGTQHVLNAATKSGTVKKIVLTSSIASIYGDNSDWDVAKFPNGMNESQFNETSSIDHQPYSYSKVLAEKEAWKIHDTQNSWDLVVINPGFVMGPALTTTSNSGSIDFMNDILKGKFKMGAPELQFSFVDVRDIAKAHILALENPKAKGRHVITNVEMNVMELASIIETGFPKQFKLPKMNAPKLLMLILGPLFGVTRKFVKLNVGHPLKLDNSKGKKELGMTYTPIENTIIDMVNWMK